MTHPDTMQKSSQTKNRLLKNQKGVSTVEYIIVLVLIAVACIAMWGKFGKTVHAKIQASEEGVVNMEEDYGE
jgi:Flp pilus assembly pilin Flp